MDIKAIRSEADYREAMAEIERLLDAPPGTADAERLEVLSVLAHAYETARWPIAAPPPLDAIRFRMEQQGLSRGDLEEYIGSRARVSEVLNRKRPLSIEMIRRLHKGLAIPLESLVQPMRTKRAKRAGVHDRRRRAKSA
jgi:HTH-type transcriptional regulator / antitoxin HigA